jgi:hypothetical protein
MPIADATNPTNAPPVRCNLIGSFTAQAGDLTASSATGLCRLLLAAGTNPDAALECYRGAAIALRIASIRAGANLTIRETTTDGPRFVRWKAFLARAVKPPVRQNAAAVPIPAIRHERAAP